MDKFDKILGCINRYDLPEGHTYLSSICCAFKLLKIELQDIKDRKSSFVSSSTH